MRRRGRSISWISRKGECRSPRTSASPRSKYWRPSTKRSAIRSPSIQGNLLTRFWKMTRWPAVRLKRDRPNPPGTRIPLSGSPAVPSTFRGPGAAQAWAPAALPDLLSFRPSALHRASTPPFIWNWRGWTVTTATRMRLTRRRWTASSTALSLWPKRGPGSARSR